MLTVADSEAPALTPTEFDFIQGKVEVYDTYNF